jgi:hypothetical protein
LSNAPQNISNTNPTKIKLAMPTEYHLSDEIESYRLYYEKEKINNQHDRARYLTVLFNQES